MTAAWLRIACLAVGVLLATPAPADDGAAALSAGGLVFVKAPGIVMQREDLTIAPSQVRVRFEMRNDHATPATLLVAFPLPDVPLMTPGGWQTRSGTEVALRGAVTQPRFIDFTVRVNGRPVRPDVAIQALLPDGRDVTAVLREAGGDALLLQPRWFEHGALAAPLRQRLLDAGAIKPANPADPTTDDVAQWTTRIAYHWMQTFPPGVTVIEHSYRPVVGFNLIERVDGHWQGTGAGDLTRGFCLDAAADTVLQRLARPDHPPFGYEVAYVLATAATWDGPIGVFHLTLDGGAGPPRGFPPRRIALTSLCSDLHLRRTGAVRFEATVRNYRPAADLLVLFVAPDTAAR